MVKASEVTTDRCPGCSAPGRYLRPMAGPGLGEFICRGIGCRVQSFIGRRHEDEQSDPTHTGR